MKPDEFLSRLDEPRIVAAIADAERRSSGEIRVFVSEQSCDDALQEARRQFEKLGMARTRHRNGVLIYFAPVAQQFAIHGDCGVHEKCGDRFWGDLAQVMSDSLRQGRHTDALLAAVGRIGELLAEHFPRDPDDRNELPDEIVRE